MADQDPPRSDPLADVITLLAAPIAGGLRSYEQFRRGIDELFRTIENLNRTMENLNDTAARMNRLMADVEEPIRTMIPQITRTVRAADEVIAVVGGPAKRVAPNLGRLADVLSSPALTTLPGQLEEFMATMGEMSRRLGPLAQFAESAGGIFGFRVPGMSRPTDSTIDTSSTTSPATPATTRPASSTTGQRTATKKAATKPAAKPTSSKTASKTSTKTSGTKTATKTSSTKRSSSTQKTATRPTSG